MRLRLPFESLALALGALLLAWLLALPPFLGMADNNDFPKVMGRFCLAPVNGGADRFLYFQPDYRFSPQACWTSEVLSSEIAIAAAAVTVSKLTGADPHFDIRWMGLFHSALFLLALVTAVAATRPWPWRYRLLFLCLALFFFADLCYSAYFNSFYSDAAAMTGFLLLAAAAATLLTAPPRPWMLAVFTLGALFFCGSKAQHALFGPALVVFLLARAWRPRRLRAVAAVCALAVALATVWSFSVTRKWYKGQALFDAIFFRIAKESPRPVETLRQLKLGPEALPWVGMHSYMPDSPAQSNPWAERFLDRVGYDTLLRFYLRNPALALQDLDLALRQQAPMMRPINLSNFRRQDGQPAGARSHRFSVWTDFRSWLWEQLPHTTAAGYLLLTLALAALARRWRGTPASRLAWLGCAILTAGAVEFGVSALADACETYRHLLMFHLMTDSGLLLALAALGARVASHSE